MSAITMPHGKVTPFFASWTKAILVFLAFAAPYSLVAQQLARRFSVADDIALTHFADPIADSVLFSPDQRYFVVVSERGRLDLNRPESSLRIYRTEAIRTFLANSDATGAPAPVWTVTRCTYKNGPLITQVRWLKDSSGLAFLAKTSSGNDQLLLADLQTRTLQPLAPADQHVTAFDIQERGRYVYTVLSAVIPKRVAEESRSAALVGTGRTLDSLIFPEGSSSPSVWVHDLSELWAVVQGRRFRVTEPSSKQLLPIHLEGQRALALSPDGRQVVTALTVRSIPLEWEALYPSPLPSSPYRIRAGPQDSGTLNGQRDVSEYVLIDLATDVYRTLTGAPLGNSAGWWGFSRASWSSDGQAIVLSNTFLSPTDQEKKEENKRPCVAVIDLAANHLDCVERLPDSVAGGPGDDWRLIYGARFSSGSRKKVIVEHLRVDGKELTTYHEIENGSWIAENVNKEALPQPAARAGRLEISVKQNLNSPPVLMANDKRTGVARVLWDPNPQLRDIKLGPVSIFEWKDETGRAWVGGLYKPPDYVDGKRYPLVIQTHGFDARAFRPSGASTTAFAAQELAATGVLVLQVRDCPLRTTPEEGPCQVAGYESAVRALVANGSVDPERVGIIGFSRTCYYVLEALVTSKLHFKAAAITDGINEGYVQYLLNVDGDSNNSVAREAEAMIGASPFGAGLERWLAHSPLFNLHKARTPLEVVATRQEVVQMWEPYATLRYLHRPVELLVLNSDEHVLTNPAERMASQGGTVDWFAFWLKDEEDPDPAKSRQNARWRQLRILQRSAQDGP